MKNLFLFPTILLLLVIGKFSAQDSIKSRVSKSNIYLAVGVNVLNEFNLNKVLSENHLSTLNRVFFPVSGGGNFYRGKFGFTLESSIMGSFSGEGKSRLSAFTGRFGLNYLLIDQRDFCLAICGSYRYLNTVAYIRNQTENFIPVGADFVRKVSSVR